MGYLALRGSSHVELTLSDEHLCFMCLKSGKARWPGRPHDFPCSWPTLLIHLIYRLWVYDFELPWWLRCKESACNAGDLGLIPGLERSPGEGNGYPLQYSGLENSMDSIVRGVAELDMTEQLSLYHNIGNIVFRP